MQYSEDKPLRAILLMLAAMAILSLQDALVKMASQDTSLWQFQALRAIMNGGFIVMGIILFKGGLAGLALLRPKRPKMLLLRSLCILFTMSCLYGAAPQLDFTQMAAGLYLYPLFVTLLAGPLLSEKIGPWRIGALIVGMVGAYIMLDPFSGDFLLVQILPMVAGLFYAGNVMFIRGGCRGEHPLTLTFYIAVILFSGGIVGMSVLSVVTPPDEWILSLPFLMVAWQPIGLGVLGLILACSVLNTTGQLCTSSAYQLTESSRIVPVGFSYLVMAVFWGVVLFDESPSLETLLGMGLIAGAGITTAVRERIRAKESLKPLA